MSRVVPPLWATAAFVLLAGCGYVGPPLPPALHMPEPVADLRVTEIGDQIIVRFTPPSQTTEDLPITEMRAITLYVGTGEAPFSRERWAAAARQYQVPVTAHEFPLPASDWAGRSLILGLRTTGRTGRESDWSNLYLLTVGVPLTVPTSIKFENAPDAISLKWSGNAPRYRVLRSVLSDPMPKLETLTEVTSSEYLDQQIAYGARYQYAILGLAAENQQSLPSEPAEFAPADIFPPAVPTGLTAVAGTRSVDLSWTRSPDSDLAGYNIFRATANGPFEPLEQRVLLPAYTDMRVESGQRYLYSVSAIDTTGNESMRSVEASAQVE